MPLGQGSAKLAKQPAAELGLKPGTPVAQGGIDAYLGMLGLGAVKAGALAMIMGSSTCHLAIADKPLLGTGMLGCFPDALGDGINVLEGGQTATGSIVNWYRQHFAGNEVRLAEQTGRNVYEILDEQAAAVPPGCDGLVCLDHFQGSRTPIKDPRSRGAFTGLTLAHGPGHLFRSIYEGTAFGTRLILEDLTKHGLQVEGIHAGGGGAKSRLWVQIHADFCGLPVHLPKETESCALGSAIVAAVHAGHYGSLAEAAGQMVQMSAVVEPGSRAKNAYDEAFERYRRTYPALKQAEGQTLA
jgi:ribulose kinase